MNIPSSFLLSATGLAVMLSVEPACSDGSAAEPSRGDGQLVVDAVKAGETETPQDPQLEISVPLGRAQCQQGTIRVTVRSLLGGESTLEAWLATGSGDCNRADRAARVPDSANCTPLNLTHPDQARVRNHAEVVEVELGPTCDNDGNMELYLLQLGSDSAAEARSYAVVHLYVDTNPPDAPTGVKAGEGASEILLTWQPGAPDTAGYFIVADWGAVQSPEDTSCTSSLVRSGQPFDLESVPQGVLVKHVPGGRSSGFRLLAEEFYGARSVPVAMAAQDLAGNVSVLSDVVCVSFAPQ